MSAGSSRPVKVKEGYLDAISVAISSASSTALPVRLPAASTSEGRPLGLHGDAQFARGDVVKRSGAGRARDTE
jgi:hypothetical protein